MDTENLLDLTNLELIEIIKELRSRVKNTRGYLSKYHKSDKGKSARAKANKKYENKIKSRYIVCNVCDKKIQERSVKSHEKSKMHNTNLELLNTETTETTETQSSESINDN